MKLVRGLAAELITSNIEGAEEVKEEILDPIMALLEAGGDDAFVLGKVETALPLVIQNLGLEATDRTLAIILGGLKVILAILQGEVLAALAKILAKLGEE